MTTGLDQLIESVSDDILHLMDQACTPKKECKEDVNIAFKAAVAACLLTVDVPDDIKQSIADHAIKRVRKAGLHAYLRSGA